MRKTPLPFTKATNNPPQLKVADLAPQLEQWLIVCDIANHSAETNAVRRIIVSKLGWFCKRQDFDVVGLPELRHFFAYLLNGHEDGDGRWDNDRFTTRLRPSTVQNYHKHLRRFFAWLVEEEVLDTSPKEKVKPVIARPDQIQPFTCEQVSALILAAGRSHDSLRNVAVVTLLFDTGLRASELCGLRMRDLDLDLDQQHLRVLGKGNKYRTIPFGKAARKSLWQCLREEHREADDPLFTSSRGILKRFSVGLHQEQVLDEHHAAGKYLPAPRHKQVLARSLVAQTYREML
jgi:site-specific recombinase XerD